jgi:hypothetical protein
MPNDPRSFSTKAMLEFKRRCHNQAARTHSDEIGPDCMYWLKHEEAALIVVALGRGTQRADLSSEIQRQYGYTMQKMAQQFNKYDRELGEADAP